VVGAPDEGRRKTENRGHQRIFGLKLANDRVLLPVRMTSKRIRIFTKGWLVEGVGW
jgi:hypothetical protein